MAEAADVTHVGPFDSADPPVLADGVVRLRGWRTEDSDSVFDACQDPAIQALANIPSPYRHEHARQFVSEIVPAGWRSHCGAQFAIEAADEPTFIGSCSFTRSDAHATHAEVGYWVKPVSRGRGYATRAVDLLSDWAFNVVGLERLELVVQIGNDASCAVARRAGFTKTGQVTRALADGRVLDVICFERRPDPDHGPLVWRT